jgi:hypothetical protein
MDTGKGNFEALQGAITPDDIAAAMKAKEAEHPQHGGWFREGEVLEIRGSKFRIKNVKPTELRLKLLPRG